MISTALRTGTPLPQVTPCPLLDRFILHHHGLNVMRSEEDDDYGLPRTMSIDILQNGQYMSAQINLTKLVPSHIADMFDKCFCVGVSTSFAVVMRLDRLMHVTKELVGEKYHIHGVRCIAKMEVGPEMPTLSSGTLHSHSAIV
jgi:Aromatic acid exporter family member 2